jgi:Rab9 effector protein with kelch motifs
MERRRKAMWLYPKVVGFNPPERWGHSAVFFEGVVYVFGVCTLFLPYPFPEEPFALA